MYGSKNRSMTSAKKYLSEKPPASDGNEKITEVLGPALTNDVPPWFPLSL